MSGLPNLPGETAHAYRVRVGLEQPNKLERLQTQHDELVAALQDMVTECDQSHEIYLVHNEATLDRARAALAKVQSGGGGGMSSRASVPAAFRAPITAVELLDLTAHIEMLTTQRDELLAALAGLLHSSEGSRAGYWTPPSDTAIASARAAIAALAKVQR